MPTRARTAALVVAAVARLQPLGADLLKLPFPVLDLAADGEATATEACRELDEAAAGTPWVLLGAGAELEVFEEQVRIAGMAGASGFLAGRGIWGAALTRDPDEAERIADDRVPAGVRALPRRRRARRPPARRDGRRLSAGPNPCCRSSPASRPPCSSPPRPCRRRAPAGGPERRRPSPG